MVPSGSISTSDSHYYTTIYFQSQGFFILIFLIKYIFPIDKAKKLCYNVKVTEFGAVAKW